MSQDTSHRQRMIKQLEKMSDELTEGVPQVRLHQIVKAHTETLLHILNLIVGSEERKNEQPNSRDVNGNEGQLQQGDSSVGTTAAAGQSS